MKRDVKLEAIYPHPPERVWEALTRPEAIARWLMENDFQPKVGHTFRFRAKPQPGWDGTVDCTVTEVDPPRRLSYSWANGKKGLTTQVTWHLEPVQGGTRLRLEHSGFEGLGGVALSFMLGSGWKRMLRTRVPAVIEGLAGSPVEVPAAQCHQDASPTTAARPPAPPGRSSPR